MCYCVDSWAALTVEHATGVHAICRNLLLLTPSRNLAWVPTALNGHINHPFLSIPQNSNSHPEASYLATGESVCHYLCSTTFSSVPNGKPAVGPCFVFSMPLAILRHSGRFHTINLVKLLTHHMGTVWPESYNTNINGPATLLVPSLSYLVNKLQTSRSCCS